ncbi:MAG: surface lipoprotein assembly modifier, partial [Giesbergeria sp.]
MLDHARALQQQGAVQEALALLDAQEAQRAGDPAFDQALAGVAEAAGLYTRALLAWERVVQAQPDNLTAQDAQARLLQSLGDVHGLQALPEAVRQRSMAVDAARSIDQHLYSYDRPGHGGRSSWHGSVDLGLGHDSNINAGLDRGAGATQIPGV